MTKKPSGPRSPRPKSRNSKRSRPGSRNSMPSVSTSSSSLIRAGLLPKWREENKPPKCPITGTTWESSDPVVDHDHSTGEIRGVISRQANSLLGKIENYARGLKGNRTLPAILRACADYLERNPTGVLHPTGYRQLYKRFARLPKAEQEERLLAAGIEKSDLKDAQNVKDRTNLYKRVLKEKYQ